MLEGSFKIFLSQSRVGEWVVLGGLVEKEVIVMKPLLSFLKRFVANKWNSVDVQLYMYISL